MHLLPQKSLSSLTKIVCSAATGIDTQHSINEGQFFAGHICNTGSTKPGNPVDPLTDRTRTNADVEANASFTSNARPEAADVHNCYSRISNAWLLQQETSRLRTCHCLLSVNQSLPARSEYGKLHVRFGKNRGNDVILLIERHCTGMCQALLKYI